MFLLNRKMTQNITSLKAAYAALPNSEKSVVRFYLQLPLDELEKKGIQQGELFQATRSNEKKPTFARQSFLYFLAYGMKKQGLTVKGGAKKTRRGKKRGKKSTRRRRV